MQRKSRKKPDHRGGWLQAAGFVWRRRVW